jgi:hypothetical protein
MAQEEKEAAQKARAERLRAQIERAKTPKTEGSTPEEEQKTSAAPESPREFIHRRMHELDSRRKD